MKVMTEAEYRDVSDGYYGVCLACGELRESTEPDAENYPCPSCGEHRVQGIENALLSGNIDIEMEAESAED